MPASPSGNETPVSFDRERVRVLDMSANIVVVLSDPP